MKSENSTNFSRTFAKNSRHFTLMHCSLFHCINSGRRTVSLQTAPDTLQLSPGASCPKWDHIQRGTQDVKTCGPYYLLKNKTVLANYKQTNKQKTVTVCGKALTLSTGLEVYLAVPLLHHHHISRSLSQPPWLCQPTQSTAIGEV